MQRTAHASARHAQRANSQSSRSPSYKAEQATQVTRTSWEILFQRGYANALAHKTYTALALCLFISSTLSALHPKASVRMLATNTSFGLWGAFIATAIGNTRLQARSLDKRHLEAEAERIQARQERQSAEIASHQQALASAQAELETKRDRLKAFEESYQAKADAAATKAAQREADKRIAAAEKRLNQTIQDTEATVKRMRQELAQGIQAAQAEAAEKVTAAEAEAHKAKADSQFAIKEFSEQMELSRQEAEASKQASINKVIAIKAKAQQQEAGAHKYKETVHQVLGDERSKVNDRVQTLSSELARLNAELIAQKNLVTQLSGPKFFNQSSLEGQIGNRIISFLIGRKVMVSGVNIGETRYGEATFYFEPINCDLKEVEDQLEALHLHTALSELPRVSIESDGTIKMVVRVNSDCKPQAPVIRRVSDRQLRQAFLDVPFGLRFTGYTGRGKSTLLNNVIWLYESEMNTRFIIFDPKVDFPSATYPNNQVYRGIEKCIANIDLIGTTVKARQDYKVLNDEQGIPIPQTHQQPKLFLIDECKDIHDAAALADLELPYKDRIHLKNFKFSIQKGLEVGRGLGVRVLYSTVTPDSSDFGFKNSVFKQSATVFLGDQCYEALSTKSQYLTTVSDSKRAQLRQEYGARVASADERDKFIVLSFNGLTNEIFFFSPPPPNAWRELSSKGFSQKADFNGVAQTIAQPSPSTKTAEIQAPQSAQPLDHLAQKQPSPASSPNLGRTGPDPPAPLSVAELAKTGSQCPYCNAHSTSFKSKRARKSDSTVRMRCNTQGCPSGGIFRVTVSDELKS